MTSSAPVNPSADFFERVRKALDASAAAKFEAALPWHSREGGAYFAVRIASDLLAVWLQAAALGYGWQTFVTPATGAESPGAIVLLGLVSLLHVARVKTPNANAAAALIAHTERAKTDPAYKAAHVKTTLQIAAVMPLVYALAWAWMAILTCFV